MRYASPLALPAVPLLAPHACSPTHCHAASRSKGQRLNKLQHVVTSFDACGGKADAQSGSGIIPVHQDVNIYVSEMEGGGALHPAPSFTLQRRRQVYLVCIEGGLTVAASQKGASDQQVELAARDAVEVSE